MMDPKKGFINSLNMHGTNLTAMMEFCNALDIKIGMYSSSSRTLIYGTNKTKGSDFDSLLEDLFPKNRTEKLHDKVLS